MDRRHHLKHAYTQSLRSRDLQQNESDPVLLNLTDPLGYPPFLIFMLPIFWTMWQAMKHKNTVPAPYILCLLGSVLFLCMWAVVGITQDVRPFLPFAFVTSP